ncbi:MAG TPA: GAF domain-containing SpoIIE family protein phosphatase, partial [Phycisphaerales bacterium]|nr:GAF domain-containing SpoIIE family protein phosphatase [Phycisphaerales bacterium]
DLLGADRATVFEYDHVLEELQTTVAHGVNEEGGVKTIRIPTSVGLAGECARTRKIINVPDAYSDTRFNQAVDKETGYRTKSILAIPMMDHDGELMGVAQVLNKKGGVFLEADEELAAALASHAAVALKRGRLIAESIEKQRLARDLELARQIQQSSFPKRMPKLTGFDLAAWAEPAEEAGGDAYDLVGFTRDGAGKILVSKSGGVVKEAMLLMADATGHGVGPALSVTQVRSMLRMAVRLGVEVQAMCRQINRQVCEDLPPGRFVTAWLAWLDDASGVVVSLSAGQAPILRYDAVKDEFEERDADTVPLGVLEDLPSDEPVRFEMKRGDVLAVISDGIFESVNAAGEIMGSGRVKDAIRRLRDGNAEEIVKAIRETAKEYRGEQPALDDQTMIVVKRR